MLRRNLFKLLAAASLPAFAFATHAQTKWDMPTGYAAANFHTENVRQFAADVDKATSGKLKITVHDTGSLFKQNEIKRAVQSGQAQIGEFLLPALANEDPLCRVRRHSRLWGRETKPRQHDCRARRVWVRQTLPQASQMLP